MAFCLQVLLTLSNFAKDGGGFTWVGGIVPGLQRPARLVVQAVQSLMSVRLACCLAAKL